MRIRTAAVAAVTGLAVAAAVTYHAWRTAGREEVRAVTERVAAAAARGDRAALAAEPLLHDGDGTADWLLRHGPTLARGYEVGVSRNGEGGFHLIPSAVTHLGVVKTSAGTLRLGFRYDRESGRLEFVTASFSTWPPG